LASLGYSGSRGERAYSIDHYNLNGYGTEYLGTPCSALPCLSRMNTQYTNINMRSGGGNSDYNAMLAELTFKDIAHSGLTMKANYTWSHALDNLSSTFSDGLQGNYELGFMDPFNPGLDHASSDFDARQRLSISGIWAIPLLRGSSLRDKILGGWELAPIFSAGTGNPYTIYDCTNAYAYCPRAQQVSATPPMGVTNVPTPGVPDNYQYYQFNNFATGNLSWYNPKVGISDVGPFPNNITGRNAFRAPGSFNIDLGVYKNTRLTEKASLQLRLEMYNAINHASFHVYGVDGEVENAFVDGYRDGSRNVQLGAKVIF
jgi:hypothetical protein